MPRTLLVLRLRLPGCNRRPAMSWQRNRLKLLMAAVVLTSLPACYTVVPSKGGGQVSQQVPQAGARQLDPSSVALPPGYRIDVVAQGLNFPTAVTFDADNGV